jgi:serine/threonine-protein kinase RsbW
LQTDQDKFRLEIASKPSNISEVETFLTEVNKTLKLDEVHFHKLLVSATEAVNNAIVHGNKSDPNKQVVLTCIIKKRYLILSVRDAGDGFDPDSIPNPLNEENLLKESGRGMFLMKTLMDEVEIHTDDKGCEVLMSMYIGPQTGLKEEVEK